MKTIALIIVISLGALCAQAQWDFEPSPDQEHIVQCAGNFSQNDETNLTAPFGKDLTFLTPSAAVKSDLSNNASLLKSTSEQSTDIADKAQESTVNDLFMLAEIANLSLDQPFQTAPKIGQEVVHNRYAEYLLLTKDSHYGFVKVDDKPLINFKIVPQLEMPVFELVGFTVEPYVTVENEKNFFGAKVEVLYGELYSKSRIRISNS